MVRDTCTASLSITISTWQIPSSLILLLSTSNNSETLEKLKSMEMHKYNLDISIRLYLREFEEGAKLAEKEVNDQAQHDNQKNDPMDIEARKMLSNKSKKDYKQASKPPKLYDKHGNPVCGYCQDHHRNYECKQNTNDKHNK
jgi:nitrate/nitrite-specific signal transduction histidine kinase